MTRRAFPARSRVWCARRGLVAPLGLLCATLAWAADPGALRSEATNTFLAGNGTALRALATTTTAWWQSTNRDEVYSAAFVQFRLAQLASSADDKAALKAAGERCVALANAAIKIDPNFTVGHAVLSACYGYLANLGGFAAIGNGRNSGKAMAAAMKLDALNPQAVLVDAVSLRFRPRIAGGDKQKAYLRAQEAAQLFAASPADWGAAEAHYWVGRGAAEAGDSAKARAAYERALALAPEFAAARKALAATK